MSWQLKWQWGLLPHQWFHREGWKTPHPKSSHGTAVFAALMCGSDSRDWLSFDEMLENGVTVVSGQTDGKLKLTLDGRSNGSTSCVQMLSFVHITRRLCYQGWPGESGVNRGAPDGPSEVCRVHFSPTSAYHQVDIEGWRWLGIEF